MGMTRGELEDFFIRLGEKSFRGRQLYSWIYRRRQTDFHRMTDIAQNLRQRLKSIAKVEPPRIVEIRQSQAGFTRKFRLTLADGAVIEAVLMKEAGRVTLCASTQVGCPLGCRFCATGAMGFRRNLTPGEIAGQYLTAAGQTEERITNVVLMGMGEPLLNYDNTAKALSLLTDGDGIAVSSRRITLSTAGIVPAIERMAKDRLPVKLAVSLNAPDDLLREKLMPIAEKYPLDELLPALRRYEKTTRHRVTFEYVLIGGVNDSKVHAKRLRALLSGFTAKLNLIEYNPVESGGGELFGGVNGDISFSRPSKEAVDLFIDLSVRPGLTVKLRKSQGVDIVAACGQLCLEKQAHKSRSKLRDSI